MPNVFHKDYTLDNNHSLHARQYADVTARDADTAFNTDAANIGKAVLVDSPAMVFTLLTTAPLFLMLSNVGVGVGNVTTSDTLVANQLLTGNGTADLVTEPLLTFDGVTLTVGGDIELTATHDFIMGGLQVVESSIGLTLMNIGALDLTTQNAIENSLQILNAITQITTSFTGPTGGWDNDGFDAGPNGAYEINGIEVISQAATSVQTLRNINALDATTTATISAAIGGVTTSDTLVAGQLLLGNGTTDIVTESDLVWDGAMFGIGITDPISTLHIVEDNADFEETVGLTIENLGTGDTLLHFISDAGSTKWTMGAQNSSNQFHIDNDDRLFNNSPFVIATNGAIGIGESFPEARLHVRDALGDTAGLFKITAAGTNGAEVRTFCGVRNPEGNVTASPGEIYHRVLGEQSTEYLFKGAVTGNTGWARKSAFPADIIEIHNAAEFDDLATAGVITVTANETWHIRGAFTTASRIVVAAGITLSITGEYNTTASITYSGTDTFLTVNAFGFLQIRANMNLVSSSTGTFLSGLPDALIGVEESQVVGWTSLGTITGTAGSFFSDTFFFNTVAGFTFVDSVLVNFRTIVVAGTDLDDTFFTINTRNPNSVHVFEDMDIRSLGTGELFDLDTRMNRDSITRITGNAITNGGDLFKLTTVTDATINSVADGSIATGTISAMADNGSGGTTISSTTTYFEDEEVTISGTTSYNGTFQIFNVVAGVSFDTITVFVADDATGSVDSVRLAITLAGGHGIVTGDSLKIIDTNFYNGFQTSLNVATNVLTVNGTFISTNTGAIERNVSLDQQDDRIIAVLNDGFANSRFIATAHVNDNSAAVGTIVNNTFTDLVFGTVGAAMLASSTMERWRLIDELNGTFEYLGVQPFEGSITFDFSVLSSGGTVDFRFKWEKDTGSGFADLDDNVEALVSVGSDTQGVSKTYPLKALKGDLIRPQITRNSGGSGITATYATMYVSM